jgi:hypothetical protein
LGMWQRFGHLLNLGAFPRQTMAAVAKNFGPFRLR